MEDPSGGDSVSLKAILGLPRCTALQVLGMGDPHTEQIYAPGNSLYRIHGHRFTGASPSSKNVIQNSLSTRSLVPIPIP